MSANFGFIVFFSIFGFYRIRFIFVFILFVYFLCCLKLASFARFYKNSLKSFKNTIKCYNAEYGLHYRDTNSAK